MIPLLKRSDPTQLHTLFEYYDDVNSPFDTLTYNITKPENSNASMDTLTQSLTRIYNNENICDPIDNILAYVHFSVYITHGSFLRKELVNFRFGINSPRGGFQIHVCFICLL